MTPETMDKHWLKATRLWEKAKRVWETVAMYLSGVIIVGVIVLIFWAIWDIAFHSAVRKQVGHNLWHQVLWAFAAYVLTKVWKWFKGAKRERTKVQSSEPQSWGRNHGGIKGRGERYGSDSAV